MHRNDYSYLYQCKCPLDIQLHEIKVEVWITPKNSKHGNRIHIITNRDKCNIINPGVSLSYPSNTEGISKYIL